MIIPARSTESSFTTTTGTYGHTVEPTLLTPVTALDPLPTSRTEFLPTSGQRCRLGSFLVKPRQYKSTLDTLVLTTTITILQDLRSRVPALFDTLPRSCLTQKMLDLKDYDDGVYTTALLTHNVEKNRFKNILADEATRIVLGGNAGHDYINANRIETNKGQPSALAFIAAQAPNTTEVELFWSMIWENKIEEIVMLTTFTGSDTLLPHHAVKRACPQYIPDNNNSSIQWGSFKIMKTSTTDNGSYQTTNLIVEHTISQQRRNMQHLLYHAWPDMGCPTDISR